MNQSGVEIKERIRGGNGSIAPSACEEQAGLLSTEVRALTKLVS